MPVVHTIRVIVGSALLGMVLGGSFGCAAGFLAPEFFAHLIPWQDVRPVGFATFLGGTVGVVLGGGMGCFAILVRAISLWLGKSSKDA